MVGYILQGLLLESGSSSVTPKTFDNGQISWAILYANSEKTLRGAAALERSSSIDNTWFLNGSICIPNFANMTAVLFDLKESVDLGHGTLTSKVASRYTTEPNTSIELKVVPNPDLELPPLWLKFNLKVGPVKQDANSSGPIDTTFPFPRYDRIADKFLSRFLSSRDVDDISGAIEHMQRTVLITPETDIHPLYLNQLGTWISRRFDKTQNIRDLDDSIEYLERAVSRSLEDDEELPLLLTNLGLGLAHRFDKTGRLVDISDAIRHQSQAILLTPDDDQDLTLRLRNLGLAYSSRFQRTSDITDISSAIHYQQRGVMLTPDGHESLPAWLDDLGTSFSRRYQQSSVLSDISSAIEYLQRAVRLTPEAHGEKPRYLNNLGLTLSHRFGRTSDLVDITNAIECIEKAIKLTPQGDSSLPVRLGNLGLSLTRRFQIDPEKYAADITNAMKRQKRAIILTPKGDPDRPVYMSHLGDSLVVYFRHTGQVDDISDAIHYFKKAVKLTPDEHATLAIYRNNVGEALLTRFQTTGEIEDTHEAIANFRLAACQVLASPITRLHAARRWARSAVGLRDQEQALEAFGLAVELLSLVANMDITIRDRHMSLVNVSTVASSAVVYAFMTGSTDKALEWLEQGRCLVWTQLNQLRTPVDLLRVRDAELAKRFVEVSQKLEIAGSRVGGDGWDASSRSNIGQEMAAEDQVREHTQLARQWSSFLNDIRKIPDFEDFLRPPRAIRLLANLPHDGPVIVINMHPQRCDALVLNRGADRPEHVPLSFTYERADDMRKKLGIHLRLTGLRMRSGDQRGIRRQQKNPLKRDTLKIMLKDLWISIVWPILESLGYDSPQTNRKHIRWCATGPLAFLPIHAAGIYGNDARPGSCISDFVVSSYIPTVGALLEKIGNARINESSEDPNILLISQANAPGMSSIPATVEEVHAVLEEMKGVGINASLLEDAVATTSAVKEKIQGAAFVHLACHGSQDTSDPLKSGFYLYDGRLDLSDIMKLQLPRAELAFLSACQTSAGDEKLSEEVVHLAAGMLAAGFGSVVATMWSIKDEWAPGIAKDFYAELMGGGHSDENGMCGEREVKARRSMRAAYALDHAIKGVREKVGDDEIGLLSWVPYLHFGL